MFMEVLCPPWDQHLLAPVSVGNAEGCCQGAGGWKTMEETQCWQTFKSLFIAVLHRNKKDQYLLVAESIILHERH